ncbi:hypothetical protein KC349_g8443 [Hortaea werneckii]|nr:hypothetical protein KC349_g8443 [Hortaea werneckii]
MRLSTTLLANLTLLSGAALAQLTTTTTTGECTSDCAAHPTTYMPTMTGTAVPYPAGNGTTIHISNCPSAYSTGGGMMTPTTPAPEGAETTPVSCDGNCPDTSAGVMPTDSGMPSSDAGPSMGADGGYSNAGGSFKRDVWLGGGVVGVLVGLLSWV